MDIAHSYIPNTDEKFRILEQLVNIRLEPQGGDPEFFLIYIQHYTKKNIRHWARMGYDRDELITDMYDHYHKLLRSNCKVS